MKVKKSATKINLIWMHSHFLYWMGGTKFVYEVVKRLQHDNDISSITLVVDRISPMVRAKFQELDCDIVELGGPTSTSFIYWLTLPVLISIRISMLRSLLQVRNLRKNSTIVVSSMFPMNVVAMRLGFAHLQNCYEPFAFFYDNEFIANFSVTKRLAINVLRLLYRGLDRAATQSSTIVLTLNSVTRALVQDVYARSSVLTQAGVDSKLFKPHVTSVISDRYKGKRVLIHSTDYSPVKGTDRVIQALALVVKKVPNAHLIITSTIKNDQAEQQLKSLAESLGVGDNCSFVGFVPIDELPQLYSLALVLVQGSSSERSGTTSMALPVKEAMCCETPVIRPKSGSEDTIDGQTGYICDPRDTAQLAQHITQLIANPTMSQKMGKAARQFIQHRYTWERTADVFAAAIKLLSSKARKQLC